MVMDVDNYTRKPPWIRVKARIARDMIYTKNILDRLSINTVCMEARCPNIFNCWGSRTVTFMILGDKCTRNCRFCSVKSGNPKGIVDEGEPLRVAMAVKMLGIKYVVLTSVDRDDLPDGGAGHFHKTIRAIRELNPGVIIEALVPDFNCDPKSIKTVIDAGIDVIGHNIETVRRLTPYVRDRRAGYEKSLTVLKMFRDYGGDILTKSGLILGLGEGIDEVVETLRDLRSVGVDIVTIGQYLMPSRRHYRVREYVHPKIFRMLEEIGYEMGFKCVVSGPRVRSSYLAGEYYVKRLVRGGLHGL